MGERSAERLVFHLLRHGRALMQDFVTDLSRALVDIRLCAICQNFTDAEHCTLCLDATRSDSLICVVEDPPSIPAIEKTHTFRGRYHVLHGHLAPLDGVGPDELRIPHLIERVARVCAHHSAEVILATNTHVGGDTTALYLAGLLQPLGAKVTRLSMGLPAGADLTYLDQLTLSRAFENRVRV